MIHMNNSSDKPIPKLMSTSAKRLRAGAYPFDDRSPMGKEARLRLASLRDALDAVARDPRSTPREKDRDAKRIVADFKKLWSFMEQKADADFADVRHAVDKLDDAVRQLESRLTPIEMKRIERVAADLERMDPNSRRADFTRAFDRKDSTRLLAHGLLDGTGDGTRRALAILCDPARFQFVLENGHGAATHRSVARAVTKAIIDLEQLDDPWREVEMPSRDLLDFANRGARVVADVDEDVGLLPAGFASLVVPPQMVKPRPPEPEQQQPQQTTQQQPAAGGSAA